MLRAAIVALLLFSVGGCGETSEPATKAKDRSVQVAVPNSQNIAADPAEAGAEETAETERGERPEQVVRAYFKLIEERKYEKAWSLRERKARDNRETETAFARSFDRYAEYRANVGEAGPVARAGEWAYVEVPVQLFGRLHTGEPFSSAGTVTLRRKADGLWRIYS